MLPEATMPCPLCGRMPRMHTTRFPGQPEGFVLSCIGDRHNVAIFKIGSPEETVAEWDRRLGPKVDAAALSDFPPASATRAELREWEKRQEATP